VQELHRNRGGGGLGREHMNGPLGAPLAEQRQNQHDDGTDDRRESEGLADACEFTGCKVLPDDRRGREGDGHRRQKHALIEPHRNAEAGLRVLAKTPNDPIYDRHIEKHQRKLSASRQSDAQQPAPNRELGSPRGRIETDIVFQAVKIHAEEQHSNRHGEGTREPRSRDAERMSGAPSSDQHRRQYRVQNHGDHLHDHRRLNDSRAAQRGTHGDQRELQRETRQEPVHILHTGAHRRSIGTQCVHVRYCQRIAKQQRDQGTRCRQQQTLIENQRRVRLVLASHRVRDEGHRAHAEHLGQREHDEHHIARGADAGDGRIAQMSDEIEVD
jgi:hypothetical protein